MRNANGQGSISWDKAREKFIAAFTSPLGKRIYKRFATRQEAADWLASQRSAVVTGSYIEPTKLTVGEWLLLWLDKYKKNSVRIRTMELYMLLASHCAPIAHIPLQKLTPPDVQALYSELLKTLSPNTVGKVHRLLHAAMKRALLSGLVVRNVIEATECPTPIAPPEIVTFTRDEIEKIYEAAKSYVGGRYFPLVYLAISTGMRMGELLALRRQDIRGNEISISRNLQELNSGKLIISPPKTRAGRRIITVPPDVIRVVLAPLSSSTVTGIDSYIFATGNGTPISPRNIGRAWRGIMKLAGIQYRNFHVLRHTHATDLLAQGVPIVEVAHRLGHARVSHTLELYGHAIPTYDQKISEKVAYLYRAK